MNIEEAKAKIKRAIHVLDTVIPMAVPGNNNSHAEILLGLYAGAEALAQIPQWVPVSDQLPETGGVYSVTINCDDMEPFVNNAYYYPGFIPQWGIMVGEVTAWMPKHAPYDPQEAIDAKR